MKYSIVLLVFLKAFKIALTHTVNKTILKSSESAPHIYIPIYQAKGPHPTLTLTPKDSVI